MPPGVSGLRVWQETAGENGHEKTYQTIGKGTGKEQQVGECKIKSI